MPLDDKGFITNIFNFVCLNEFVKMDVDKVKLSFNPNM